MKNQKIFSANNEQGSMERGEKWFSEKLRKIVVVKGRPAFRGRITRRILESPQV